MMKNLIVSILLLEMILLPFSNSTIFGSNISYAEECSQGMIFDSSLNRCVYSQQTIEDKTNARNCENLEGDAYKKCFNDNVDKEMAEAQAEGKVKSSEDPEAKYGVPAIVTLASGYILLKKSDTLKQCGQTSMWLMLGGGVSSLLGEFMAQRSYKKKVDGLAEKYTARMQDKPLDDGDVIANINENQKIAFDFQIEQEKAREKAHSSREKAYKLAFGLYTAAVVASLYDAFMGGKGCESAYFTPLHQKPTSQIAYLKNKLLLNYDLFGDYHFIDELSEYEYREILLRKVSSFFISPVYAEEEDETKESNSLLKDSGSLAKNVVGKSEGPEEAVKELADNSGTDDWLDKGIKNPYIRAAIAGILAMYSKKVADKAGELADAAKERVEVLEELKKNFIATGGAGFAYCSDDDRRNTSKPACYCYLSDGSRDPSKTTSGICASVYAKMSDLTENIFDPSSIQSQQGLKGCFTQTNQFDADCSCKEEVDSNNNDSCLRINGKLKLGSLGSISGMKDMMKDTVAFSQGNISTADLNSTNTDNLALRLTKAKNKLAKNPKYKDQIKKVDKLQKKLRRQIAAKTIKGVKSGSLSNPFLNNLGGSSTPTSAKDVLKNMKKTIKENKAQFSTGKSLARSSKSTPSIDDLNFNSSAKTGGVTIEDVDDIMKKDYAFNDISENTDSNIFKIITNRYQRSGLKRLFDEKDTEPVDSPNATEINEK